MRMTLVRTVNVSGFSADANPNVTAPAANKLFTMEGITPPGDQLTTEDIEGLRMCVRFVDNTVPNANVEVPAANCDFQVWEKDEAASDTVANGGLGRDAYIALKAETAAPSSGAYACTWKGKIFIQLKAVNTTGAATQLLVYAEASTSVPG